MLNKIIRYFLENRLVTFLILLCFVAWGIITAPFGWKLNMLPSDPVAVDAIPDIGENQQIVFTQWAGRSPQDIEDQITYPLSTSLLGIPGVKSIRCSSVFGFSSIYLIFDESVDFYWSRSRILEKLNSLPSGILPTGVQPTLGPDATALGQVYWYTLEGRDKEGNPTGGWDLPELRSVQDFYVKYGLNAVNGVSEVASIGGFIQEYQIDVNPEALKTYQISLHQVMQAVSNSNKDVGAKTIEINQAEYLVRGLGYIHSVDDLESSVVRVKDFVPIRIKDIGRVSLGPATRRGILDKDGAEVVGGVVVTRYGSNPMQVIQEVKDKIKEIAPGLPKKTLANGVESQLTIVPFYDRSHLIQETLGTLEDALTLEILITILVVVVMVFNLRASLLISSLLPLAILMVFIAMRYFGVDANIVALSGIAIAIGTMVDLGIVLSENIIKHLDTADKEEALSTTIFRAASEVSTAIVTAVTTTIISFIPVFTMQAAEGKLFRPLAFTKSFALLASLFVALVILPTLAHWFFGLKLKTNKRQYLFDGILALLGIIVLSLEHYWAGITLLALGMVRVAKAQIKQQHFITQNLSVVVVVASVCWLLAKYWLPLGPEKTLFINYLFVACILFSILLAFYLLEKFYPRILRWCLDHKKKFLLLPAGVLLLGALIWIGFSKIARPVEKLGQIAGIELSQTEVWSGMNALFPGIGKEFMPSLNEGSFLLMPTSMPHAGVEQNKKVLQQLDRAIKSIPEIEIAVGKLGRVESALDPAPISMYENIIQYKTEYVLDDEGNRLRFKVNENGDFILKSGDTLSNETAVLLQTDTSALIPDEGGTHYRNWRNHVHSPDDIWTEIIQKTKIPGVTSAPKLQPIETRLVMLQTGMRAPMGIKIYGPDLKVIQDFGLELEKYLKEVSSVKQEAVFADRLVGKPYLILDIKREKINRYGLNIQDVQQSVETAIGGMTITSTVEGRERYPVRVRYPRELRDDPEKLKKILIATPMGVQVPLGELIDIGFERGPQMIKSENTFLVGYVLFDKADGFAEVDVVEDAEVYLQSKIENGDLKVPAGVSYKFSGSYENQIRAEKRLSLIVPLVLILIFLILYFQFKSVSTSLMIFSGIAMAFSGAFLLLWLYGQPWFANFSIFGSNLRTLFQMHPVNLSVAVWVGFIALFGIATDDGVLMGTYLDQSFSKNKTNSISTIRLAVIEAGKKRIRPAIMTTATTIIALLPVLSSTGRGSDIMVPMAIPAFGGMLVACITYFIVPVLYSWREEYRLKKKA